MSSHGHQAVAQNYKAHLTNAYNELGKELSSHKIRVVGNYTLGKVIGEGAYGKVRMGSHRLTATRVAVKQIPKAMSSSLTREIHHHRELHHPHVVQLYEVIATESSIWLVAELCSGGELFDYLVEKGRLSEEETRVLFGQLCLAVAYVHSKGIVHRDLKLENVLLDEHCRVKLSDFGFTREYERGTLLDTYCGTTGYAAPEMLLAQKYLGPEVDVWSLGIILYTLLTGALPFDDDDEAVMREKIIKGDFEDPEWLSDEARDLIQNILQKDPTKRLSISQILAHKWFTSPPPPADVTITSPSATSLPIAIPSPSSPEPPSAVPDSVNGLDIISEPSSASEASGASFVSAPSEPWPSTPTTPDEGITPAVAGDTTLETLIAPRIERPPTNNSSTGRSPAPSIASRIPPPPPTRTPARTKRRSVSSALSETLSLTDKPLPPAPPQDFADLLSKPAPLLFSTKLERELLNTLSVLGFDTAQMVHSVLSNACDAAGAMWWMLIRRAELKALEDGQADKILVVGDVEDEKPRRRSSKRTPSVSGNPPPGSLSAMHPTLTHSAPELAFVPATPTATHQPPMTPPPSTSPTLAYLSPAPSAATVTVPTTPSGKEKEKAARRESKIRNRSGSVSIMQRATTALEAAGLVRKKSSEAVKEEKELPAAPRADDSSRSSHTSSKLTKSPPLRAIKDALVPSTSSLDSDSQRPDAGPPWLHADGKRVSTPHSPEGTGGSISPGDTLTSLPDMDSHAPKNPRNRASLLTAFRMWFVEDRKGKRKSSALPANDARVAYNRSMSSPGGVSSGASGSGTRSRRGSMKRGTSDRGPSKPLPGRPVGYRNPRVSVGSRRSSSVNSRRSSITSMQMLAMDSPSHEYKEYMPPISRQRSDASRRSVGTHTPNSDRGNPAEYGDYPSRPSSVLSTHNRRHRKSPSASSGGSAARHSTSSPLPHRHHRRGGSGSSARGITVRTMHSPQTKHRPSAPRLPHARSNSATSVQSLGSSHPGSLNELSESDLGSSIARASSPRRARHRRSFDTDSTPRRGGRYAAALSPLGTSWKKSWGREPPGWNSRATHMPVEVLAIGPAPNEGPVTVRDVFAGRLSLSLGDDSDWVDEDDDVPAFAGGVGQLPASAHGTLLSASSSALSSKPTAKSFTPEPSPYILNAPPKKAGRANTPGKRNNRNGKSAQTPPTVPEAPMHEVPEIRPTRRQPVGRAAGSFGGIPIQEEEEEEEEE